MGDALVNDEKILNRAALQKHSTVDPVFLAEQTKRLITLITWIFKGPPLKGNWSLATLMELPPLRAVAGYLDFYKAHLTILAMVLASVKKVEPIRTKIGELQDNINAYRKQTSEVVTRIQNEFPTSPWTNVKGGPLIIVLAPLLKQDPKFVTEWNTYLDAYQALMQFSSSVTESLADQGNRIERETPQILTELRAELEKIKTSISIDVVLKFEYAKLLDFIELDVKTRVQSARSAATDAHKVVQKALDEVRKAQRL
jgi:hypothetical protein